MNSSGTRSRDKAGRHDGQESRQAILGVMSEDGTVRASPSIAMPRAKTELAELLAGDKMLCVRRPSPGPVRPEVHAGVCGINLAPGSDASPGPTMDEDLSLVIDAWPDLPRSVRAAVLAMIHETARTVP